nr:T9SS type A sorting domain-containing protein [uncultured Flavobacterium sp.]
MMKKIFFIFIFCSGVYNIMAQEVANDYILKINTTLYDVGDIMGHPENQEQLINYANQGNTDCLNWLGLLYVEGLGVEKNEKTAFDFIKKAANQGNSTAAYNLGRFYMIGTGCNIDFDKAKYWLTSSANKDNNRAAYGLGYMYLKGFGVPQNYQTAISWFEKSNYPMAKHWLGVCYYFGYGVAKNGEKAIMNFSESQTPNSKMMLKHIVENVRQTVESDISIEVNEKETSKNSAISKEVIQIETGNGIPQKDSKINKKDLKLKYFEGKWKGKLIELDWSGKEITNVVPVTCEFTVQDKQLLYKLTINNKEIVNTAILENNNLYFEDLNITMKLPYSDSSISNTIDWKILSAQTSFKTINNKTYLTASIETFTSEWNEPGPPKRLILKGVEEDSEELSNEELIAISSQKEQFIILYPNPAEGDVLISYELKEDAYVSVSVYDYSGNIMPINLDQENIQTAGQHHYTLNSKSLKAGMYIVKVAVDKKSHTRILIKK